MAYIAYLRVSTRGQAESGARLEAQYQACISYAERQGDQIADCYRDEAERIKELPAERIEILMDHVQKQQTYSLKDASELLSCHRETLRRAIKRGDLMAVKLGRDYRISRADLVNYWKNQGGGDLFEQ